MPNRDLQPSPRHQGIAPAPPTACHERPSTRHTTLVVIGASAGGPTALAETLRTFPVSFSAPIVIVQHVGASFAPGIAQWLSQQSSLPVRVAKAAERPTAGAVLMAGTDEHLAFITASTLGYVEEPRDAMHRPSIDVFFQSVCRYWTGSVVAALLTGMGRDGAQGLKALRDAGAFTIAQDRASSAIYGMPSAAAALGAATEILSLESIGPRIAQLLQTDLPRLRRSSL